MPSLFPRRARDLVDLPFWRDHFDGQDLGAARVCFGPGARLITWLARADGLVLGRRVFLTRGAWQLAERGSRGVTELLEHELVHVEQYRRLGFVGFLVRYLREYLAGRLRGMSHWQAYRGISLEVEARRVAAERMVKRRRGLG